MTDGRARDAWNAERARNFAEHIVEGPHTERLFWRVARNVGELPEDDPGTRGECAGEPQLGEHAVDPIHRFIHVFHHDDGAAVVRRVWRSRERAEDREIPSDQSTARPPGRQYTRPFGEPSRVLAGKRAAQRLA